ncbi:MAG: hypothetical protein RLZZ265_2241, partial [Verrucomicrobiota bacterium]|jgi:hypothetical protein
LELNDQTPGSTAFKTAFEKAAVIWMY